MNMRWLGIIAGILVLVGLVFGVFGPWVFPSGPFGWGGMMDGWGNSGMIGGWGGMMGGWFGGPMMWVFWLGIIGLIIWAVSSMSGTTRPGTHDEALEILRQRYARGEISREEYEQAREALR